jgi:hypothetical protein
MDHARSVPEIFIDVINQVTILMRTEGQLARAELSEKVQSDRRRAGARHRRRRPLHAGAGRAA